MLTSVLVVLGATLVILGLLVLFLVRRGMLHISRGGQALIGARSVRLTFLVALVGEHHAASVLRTVEGQWIRWRGRANVAPPGDQPIDPPAGVREPLVPRPGGDAGAISLEPPPG